MAARMTAAERTRRLLAILPSLVPGTAIPLATLAASVGADPADLAADITTLSMCGVPPFDPYDLVDVFIDGDRVIVGMGLPALDRPVRLSAAEARALAAALETAGFSSTDPLLLKVAAVASADVDPEELARRIRTAATTDGLGDVYRIVVAATEAGETLDLTYFSASASTTRVRRVRPGRVFNQRGAWYLLGLDESLGEVRTFRIDRIREAVATGERNEHPVVIDADTSFAITSATGEAHVHFDYADGLEERDWPGTVIALTGDEGADVRVPFATTGWLARRVAGALGDAEVTGPVQARVATRTLAEAMLAELDA